MIKRNCRFVENEINKKYYTMAVSYAEEYCVGEVPDEYEGCKISTWNTLPTYEIIEQELNQYEKD